jgi:hypothetical protein
MGGALLDLAATGPENIMLYGNPSFSFWHGTWQQFTNFGIQTFRLDYSGQPALRDAESTRIRFKVPRNGDLVTQTYVSIDLPDIYSSIPAAVGASGNPVYIEADPDNNNGADPLTYQPYEFQWNEKPGFSFIERVEIYLGGHLMDDYTGEALAMEQERDVDAKQDELLDQMIGNTTELTDPAKAAFEDMQQVATAAYDSGDAAWPAGDNIMVTRMAEGGQMMYSGTASGAPFTHTYQQSNDYTTPVIPFHYPPYVLNSYPHSWPWRAAGETAVDAAPWVAQDPLPNAVLPPAKDISLCTKLNTPSIRGRQLLIPLNNWFGRNSKAALPLVALQYSELEVFVTFRPLNEWFTIMKYMPPPGGYTGGSTAYSTDPSPNGQGTQAAWTASRCNPPSTTSGYTASALDPATGTATGTNLWPVGMPQRVAPQEGGVFDYRGHVAAGGLQHRYDPAFYIPDPKNLAVFLNPTQTWDPNIHLIANYVMLDEDEASLFAQDEQTYLVRTTHEFTYYGVRTADSVDIETSGLVASLTWRFRRSDVHQRNQWLNYTNWRFLNHPNVLPMVVRNLGFLSRQQPPSAYAETNERAILQNLSIWIDGKERETNYARGVWEYMQKYQRSNSGLKAIPGVDFYTFEVKTNPFSIQPSGSFNMSKHRRLTLMFSLLQPPLDPTFNNNVAAGETTSVALPGGGSQAVCLPVFNKNNLQQQSYSYDLNVYVEKYNMLVITGGMGALAYTR